LRITRSSSQPKKANLLKDPLLASSRLQAQTTLTKITRNSRSWLKNALIVERIWFVCRRTSPITKFSPNVALFTGMIILKLVLGSRSTVSWHWTTKPGFRLVHSPRPVLKTPKGTIRLTLSSTQRGISSHSIENYICSKLNLRSVVALTYMNKLK